ncbi:MAG TPA: hypothetical protein VE343_14000 [Streptosporangiaceae bacterium]|jgi:hypothetical protein|nr:hypothetical protein [Streptosporangiaceae bacterium]
MQLIEQTGFGVRSAALTLARPGSSVRFVLFPMLHLGSPAFYRSVRRRLEECDDVVVEGVGGRSASVITLAYRIGGGLRRGGLVDQGRGLDLTGLPGRVIRPDLTAEQFAQGWRKVARWLRWLLVVAAPLFGLWLVVVGPRRALGRNLALDDLPSRDEEELSEATPGLDEAMLAARDRALCRELVRIAEESGPGAPRTVGVCWGAGHMRAVIALLHTRLGYRVTGATWITVF